MRNSGVNIGKATNKGKAGAKRNGRRKQAENDTEREEGIPEGERKRAVEMAQRMLRKNRPIDEIAEFTGLAEDEIKSIKI